MIDIVYPPIGEPHDGPKWTKWYYQLAAAFNAQQKTGTTAQRPSPAPFIGFMYFDTTLGKPIWAKGLTLWVDSAGTHL